MIQKLYIFLLLFFTYSNIAISGGWVISGGDLLKDATNPWFIKTWNVSYCIQMDEKNFSLSKSAASKIMKNVINAWKNDFKNALMIQNQFDVKANFFSLTEADCYPDIDLKIKFGYLEEKEKKYLSQSNRHVAVSVRTQYDPIRLKGKGFIYISPDRGTENILQSQNPNLPDDFWSLSGGKLVYLTLLHELGHIYGIQHEGEENELMSHAFVDSIFRGQNYLTIIKENRDYSFFTFNKKIDHSYCKPKLLLHYKASEFFGLPSSWKCLRIIADSGNYKVYGKLDDQTTEWSLLGQAKFQSEEIVKYRDVINLNIDWDQQSIFPTSQLSNQTGYINAIEKKAYYRKVGHYIIQDGQIHRPFFVNYLQGHTQATGALGDELIPSLENISLKEE